SFSFIIFSQRSFHSVRDWLSPGENRGYRRGAGGARIFEETWLPRATSCKPGKNRRGAGEDVLQNGVDLNMQPVSPLHRLSPKATSPSATPAQPLAQSSRISPSNPCPT